MVEKLAVLKVVSEVRVVKTVKMAVAFALAAAVRRVNAAWAGVAETASAVAKEPALTAVFVAAVGQRAGAQAWARAAAWGGVGGLLRGQAGLQLASVLLSAALSPVVPYSCEGVKQDLSAVAPVELCSWASMKLHI